MTEKEVHIEKQIEKQKASITYSKEIQDNYSKGSKIYIEVKDDTSEKAFKTFLKVKKATLESKNHEAKV